MAGKVGGKPGEEVALTDNRYSSWVHSALTDGRLFVASAPPNLGRGYYLMTPNPGDEPKFERIECDLAKKGLMDRVSVSPSEPTRYLTRKLKLVVNEQESRVCSTDGVEFLGFVFQGYGGQFRVARKNLDKFQARVRELTRRTRGISFDQRCVELRRYFQGWVGYFRLVPIKSFFGELDKWVRRRIRMCFWVNWKTGRTRAANLMKLGVAEHEAFTHGMSSKGPWVLSSSQAVHQALSTALLEEWGLPSLLGIWKKLTAKSRTA